MSFQSDLTGLKVIDDKSVLSTMDGGYVQRDYSAEPCGGTGYAAPFNRPLIPESEWRERIEERERKGMRTLDLIKATGYRVKRQGGSCSNGCWANGSVMAAIIKRMQQGQPFVDLSAASIMGPITGYRNVGGWGTQAIKYIAQHGIAPVSLWPENQNDRRYDTAASRAARADYKAHEWDDLEPRNYHQLMTCLLLGEPVITAMNWMRHLVLAIDPVYSNGRYGIATINSGLYRDSEGFTVFLGDRAIPDEHISLRAVMAS